jgi:hypothetical protein
VKIKEVPPTDATKLGKFEGCDEDIQYIINLLWMIVSFLKIRNLKNSN